MFCPLCGTFITLPEDGIYHKCDNCDYNEELMAAEEMQVP